MSKKTKLKPGTYVISPEVAQRIQAMEEERIKQLSDAVDALKRLGNQIVTSGIAKEVNALRDQVTILENHNRALGGRIVALEQTTLRGKDELSRAKEIIGGMVTKGIMADYIGWKDENEKKGTNDPWKGMI